MSSNMRLPLRRRRTASLGMHIDAPFLKPRTYQRCLSETLTYSNKSLTKIHMFHFHFEKETMKNLFKMINFPYHEISIVL